MASGHIYKTIDLVGTSEAGVSEAVQAAISRAALTVKGLDWFEVGDIRGRIEGGKAVEFQVAVKIGL